MHDSGRCDGSAGLEPGHIWLIEAPVTSGLSALERRALCRADAVLYDCALASLIADVLLAGGYAEPLSAEAANSAAAISPRALKLASDGWSVVQLVRPCHQWRHRLRSAADELERLSGTGNLAIRVIAKSATDPVQIREVRLSDLPEPVDGAGEPLTAIVGPLAARASAAARAFTANGLAG